MTTRRTLTELDTLAKQTRDGDLAATEEFLLALYEHLTLAVHRLALRAGYRGLVEADCADLVHDVLISLWQEDLPEWRERKGSFLTFANMRIRWSLASRVRQLSRFEDNADMPEMAGQSDPEALLALAAHERQLKALTYRVNKLDPVARALVRRVDLRDEPLTRVARQKNLHITRACRKRQKAHADLAVALAA